MVNSVRTDVGCCDENLMYITSPVQHDRIYFNDKKKKEEENFDLLQINSVYALK
jgi:hypothetical protein